MTITEFLTARLDEDEAVARAAGHGNSLVFHDWNADWVQVELPDNVRPTYDVRHIKQFSPARVLAEVEAKRRIVEEFEVVDRFHREASSSSRTAWVERRAALLGVLMILALPYADHPDYDEAWRPLTPSSDTART